MFKRYILSFAVLFISLFLMTNSAFAISISVNPSSQNVTEGDSFTVNIDIEGLGFLTAPSLGDFDLDLSFDSGILCFNNMASSFGDPILGDQLDVFSLGGNPAGFDDSISGIVNLYEISLDDPFDLEDLQADSFTLATLTLDTLTSGTSSLNIYGNTLGDAWGDPLTADNVYGGSVTVTDSASVPEPATCLLLLFGFVGMIGVKKKFS